MKILQWLRDLRQLVRHVSRIALLEDQTNRLQKELESCKAKLQSQKSRTINAVVLFENKVCEIDNAVNEIKKRTDIHVDVSYRSEHPSSIILCGYYKNRAYVNSYRITPGHFEQLVEEMRHRQKLAEVKVLDAPPVIEDFILNTEEY